MEQHKSENISRRKLLTTGAVAAGGVLALPSCAVSTAASANPAWGFDLDNPNDALKLYAKIAGSAGNQEIYMQYYGEIFSIEPGKHHIPVLGLKGLIRQTWTANEDGTHTYVNFDHGLFCDHQTGEVLDRFSNPFTGETNDPLHYRSGPIGATLGLGEGQENPSKKTWQITGNNISVTRSGHGKYKNPVSPDVWGKASTGEMLFFSSRSTYFASVEQVSNPSLDAVDSHHTWLFVAPYPAWMKMGDHNGNVIWNWAATKFRSKADIDPYILAEVEKRVPDFMIAEKPWPKHSDGWTQYSQTRQPD